MLHGQTPMLRTVGCVENLVRHCEVQWRFVKMIICISTSRNAVYERVESRLDYSEGTTFTLPGTRRW